MKTLYKFHQFVMLDKGPVNTALSDLLSGEIYQVPNHTIEKFQNKRYSEIPDIMESLREAGLVIEVGEYAWLPYTSPVSDKEPAKPHL